MYAIFYGLGATGIIGTAAYSALNFQLINPMESTLAAIGSIALVGVGSIVRNQSKANSNQQALISRFDALMAKLESNTNQPNIHVSHQVTQDRPTSNTTE